MAVPDPDLAITGGGGAGGGPLDPEISGGGWSPKNFFRPFGSQFGLKIRAGAGPSLDPPLNDSSQGSLFPKSRYFRGSKQFSVTIINFLLHCLKFCWKNQLSCNLQCGSSDANSYLLWKYFICLNVRLS